MFDSVTASCVLLELCCLKLWKVVYSIYRAFLYHRCKSISAGRYQLGNHMSAYPVRSIILGFLKYVPEHEQFSKRALYAFLGNMIQHCSIFVFVSCTVCTHAAIWRHWSATAEAENFSHLPSLEFLSLFSAAIPKLENRLMVLLLLLSFKWWWVFFKENASVTLSYLVATFSRTCFGISRRNSRHFEIMPDAAVD